MPMFERCRWLNEPDDWTMEADHLTVLTGHATDFWRETHYGFTRDSGHFFGREVTGGFTTTPRGRGSGERRVGEECRSRGSPHH